ncbi:hypothetical protein DYB32_006617 [Aphanomyces invadans]|uniref:RanBD1 domain-containing protein n=1 Tax=Aphanomyces invadans TaxID=157072 RepID=A0A418ARA0_9STRA|nr:hypothetical protein DYB32_006617 [Aphanomyces invadans]
MSSPHAKSPLNKRPRVNTEGHDGTDRGHKEEEADALPVSPSKKTASPSKPHTKDDQADKVEVQHLIVPKVELPKDYQHMTGEEDEDVLLVVRTTAKLYKLVDKDYVECGGGPFKVLEPKDKSTRGRVVMRRATSDFKAGTQLLLNSLLSSIPSAVVKGKSIIMPVLVDASKITTYCIRFESAEYADKLQQLIQNAN